MRKLSIILIVIMALGWTSCDKQLDISPRQSIETEKVFTNGTNLEAALAGAYSEIKGTFNGPFGGELYGGDFNLFSELLASDGNVIWGGSFSTYRQLYNKSVITTNVLIANDWIRAYNAINNLNNVLAHLDVADDQDQADRVQGEALALRSMIYFELVRLWSRPWGTGTEATDPGVPLVLSAVNTVEDAEKLGLIGRSTVKDVYDQVIDDLAGQPLAHLRQVTILLHHLARDVERQVVGVDHTAHEAQVRRQQLLAPLENQDPADVELQPELLVPVEQARRSSRGDEQQRPVLEPTFGAQR